MVDRIEQPVVEGFCMMVDKVSQHVYEAIERGEVEKVLEKALDDFRGGKPLADVARDLVQIDLATEHDVAYIESLPQWMHVAVQATILEYIEREPRWTVFFRHEPADKFALRWDEQDSTRVATLVLIGPHEGPAPS